MKKLMMETDEWYRGRLRIGFWKQWKRIGTKTANLIKVGIPKSKAVEYADTRKGYWHIAKRWILSTSVTNERLKQAGHEFLTDCYLNARKLN
jgi:RNA-directed DNA polymerase